MRTRTRLAATAGATVVGFTAMSGIAQADTRGPGLVGGLTDTLGKTVSGLTGQPATEHGTSNRSGLHVNLPVHVQLPLPSSRRAPSHPVVDVKAPVRASVGQRGVRLSAGLCVSVPAQCPSPQPPPSVPPPPSAPPGQKPPSQPPGPPPGNAPASSGSLAVVQNDLPTTGGPLGVLALIGAAAVLTGAAGMAGSRLRLKARS